MKEEFNNPYDIKLHFIKYHTMNSWNNSKAPAFNLKIYKVIPRELQNKVYEMLDTEDFYNDINWLIRDFEIEHNYEWQAGFNGRSGGYLVLYKGGRKTKKITEDLFKKDNGYGGRAYISDRFGWKSLDDVIKLGILNCTITTSIYSSPGKEINFEEVPKTVLHNFKQLAIDIVNDIVSKAKHCKIEEVEYTVTKKKKVLVEEENE